MSNELMSGTNQEERRFGAVMSRTTTKVKRIPGEDVKDLLDESLATSDSFGNSSARITGVELESDCSGLTGVENILIELTETEEAWPLNIIRWDFRSSPSMETTSVDIDGDPIIVQYPPSLDYVVTGGTFMAFQYTVYEEQTSEVEVYIGTRDITGTRYKLIPDNQLVAFLTSLYEWENTINSQSFFGHPRGCVLCLGSDAVQIGIRPNGDHLLEQTFRFITRPGRTKTDEDGWHSWAYWVDPVSGMVPRDIETQTGAVKQSRHYEYKNHSVLYLVSVI